MSGTETPAHLDSADQLGDKLDRCITDSIVKLGGGVLIGSVASLLFLRRRRWPIITGAGVGLGIAYANCQSDLGAQYKSKA